MNKKIILVLCYSILPWLFGQMNDFLLERSRALAHELTHMVWIQTIFPILYALNLTLFLCLLAYLFYKIFRNVKHYTIISILGVTIYPLSYYLVFILSYLGVGNETIYFATNNTPFLYFNTLSLSTLIAVSMIVIIANVFTIKGYLKMLNREHQRSHEAITEKAE